MDQPLPKPFQTTLTTLEVSKIHWKSEAMSNIFFGLPMALLAVASWGFSSPTIGKLIVFYLAIYFLIYFPFFYLFPKLTLRPYYAIFKSSEQKGTLTKAQAKQAIEFLVNAPIRIAITIFFIVLSAFFLAAALISIGTIPDFLPIVSTVVTESIILGFAVAITEAFLNQLFMESRFNGEISQIIREYPEVLSEHIKIQPINLTVKVFFLIFITILAAHLSVTLFFITNFQVHNPALVPQMITFTLILLGLIIIYILIIAPVVAQSVTRPLNHLLTWNKNIMEGKTSSKIDIITNDEIGEVVHYSNKMMEQLNETKTKLVQSLRQSRQDKSIIANQNKKLSVILSEIIDGVIALDERQHIVLVNKAAKKLLEKDDQQLQGQHIDDVLTLFDEKNKRILAPQYCRDQQDPYSTAQSYDKKFVRLESESKEMKYINMTVTPINTNQSSRVKYLLTIHDVTREKEFDENKLDFISLTAHELQSPLTSIIGYSSILEDDTFTEEQKHIINRINASAKQLGELVQNLLNVTRLEKNTLTVRFQSVDWVDLISKVIEEQQFDASEREVTLTFIQPETTLPPVTGDQLKLHEILSNLLSNALKYTPKDGSVTISTAQKHDQIVTRISDTGIGIPKDAIPQLFSKYYRVKSDKTVQNTKGTGLGLYIVRKLLDLHHGRIWVESEEGKGSTFSFSLPIREDSNRS